jgi:hypothetical protein
MKVINRKTLGTVCLVIATFLNPMGFDILVYKLTQLTNDYWTTMYVLYVSALLLFGLSYLSFKKLNRVVGNSLLTLAMFINPLGYDLVVYGITLLTKDYWMTISFMYVMTIGFFGLFMYLYNINPLVAFKFHLKETHNKIKSKIRTK